MKKSIAIVGEGQTEYYYFDSLRRDKNYHFAIKPDYPRKGDTDIASLEQKAISLKREGNDYVFCLVDMDRIIANDKEARAYTKIINKNKKRAVCDQVIYIESNPSTETWFWSYFNNKHLKRCYHNSKEVINEIKIYLPNYEKKKKYLASRLYKELNCKGNLEVALNSSKELSDSHEIAKKNHEYNGFAYSEIYKVFSTIGRIRNEE